MVSRNVYENARKQTTAGIQQVPLSVNQEQQCKATVGTGSQKLDRQKIDQAIKGHMHEENMNKE